MITCPTCGQEPAPKPRDWLTEDEVLLVEFLTLRLSAHRDKVEEHASGPYKEEAVVASDLASSAGAIVQGFAWTRDPSARANLRFPLLLLTQPWIYHPDNKWVDELKEKLGCL